MRIGPAASVTLALLVASSCVRGLPPPAAEAARGATDAGSRGPLPPWSQRDTLKASNAGAGDYLGGSVALSADGNTLAVGATGEASHATGINGDPTDNSARGSGAVYVFTRGAGAWSQQAYLKASNTMSRAAFGFGVRLSADGNTLAVGSYGESSGGSKAGEGAPGSGAVYVFVRRGGGWTQQALLKAADATADDAFGAAIALSADGNTLASSRLIVIRGSLVENPAPPRHNAVYLFERGTGGWTQRECLEAPLLPPETSYGAVLALSADGDTLAIGDPQAGGSAAFASGAVTLFARARGGWARQAYLKAATPASGSGFGKALALSGQGSTLAVGAPGRGGAVSVFTRSGVTWAHEAALRNLAPRDDEMFGHAVSASVDGNRLAIGAPGAGRAYVFERASGAWTQQASLKTPAAAANADFGAAIAVSGDGTTVAVGAKIESRVANDSGAVVVFAR